MNEMIERVARAIFEANSGPWELCNENGREAVRHEARAAIEAMNQWLPIKTAPKDETLILLLIADINYPADEFGSAFSLPANRFLGKWNPEGSSWADKNGIVGAGSYKRVKTGNWVSSGGSFYQPNEVTAWLPIPMPPKAAG